MTNQLVPKSLPTERKHQLSSRHKHSPVPRTLPASGYSPTPHKGPDFSSLLQGPFSQSSPTLFGRYTRPQSERWTFLENRTSVTFALYSLPAVGTFVPTDKSGLSHSLVLCMTSHVYFLALTPSYTYIALTSYAYVKD